MDWYDRNIMVPAVESGNWDLQFGADLLSGDPVALGKGAGVVVSFVVAKPVYRGLSGRMGGVTRVRPGGFKGGGSAGLAGGGGSRLRWDVPEGVVLVKPKGGSGPGAASDLAELGKRVKVVTAGAATSVLRTAKNPYAAGGGLKPNVRYRSSAPGTNRKYYYETNAQGLIERVTVRELHLKASDRDRLKHDRNTPDKLSTDEAGHLIADVFDGSPALDNLVSQAMKVNRGAGSKWAAMERQWRSALSANPPKKVTDIEIEVQYDGSKRPTGFEIKYKIDGVRRTVKIPNPTE